MQNKIIQQTENFVHEVMANDSTGHDWFHIERVRRNALFINSQEKEGDPFIIELAALLHDIPDEKLNESAEKGQVKLDAFLQRLPISSKQNSHIKEIVNTISFKGGKGSKLTSIEAKIVQDADRLDAIGAIGIARAFAYGGKKGNPIYNPALKVREEMTLEEYRRGKSSSLHHFYEKLLLLSDRLHTNTAKSMAEGRHQFMEQFLREFYKEWNGQSYENANG